MVKPYRPSWAKDGCKIVEEWSENFTSGNKHGIVHRIRYKNANGKIKETIRNVEWLNQ